MVEDEKPIRYPEWSAMEDEGFWLNWFSQEGYPNSGNQKLPDLSFGLQLPVPHLTCLLRRYIQFQPTSTHNTTIAPGLPSIICPLVFHSNCSSRSKLEVHLLVHFLDQNLKRNCVRRQLCLSVYPPPPRTCQGRESSIECLSQEPRIVYFEKLNVCFGYY